MTDGFQHLSAGHLYDLSCQVAEVQIRDLFWETQACFERKDYGGLLRLWEAVPAETRYRFYDISTEYDPLRPDTTPQDYEAHWQRLRTQVCRWLLPQPTPPGAESWGRLPPPHAQGHGGPGYYHHQDIHFQNEELEGRYRRSSRPSLSDVGHLEWQPNERGRRHQNPNHLHAREGAGLHQERCGPSRAGYRY